MRKILGWKEVVAKVLLLLLSKYFCYKLKMCVCVLNSPFWNVVIGNYFFKA